MHNPKNILFVCTANICRSVFAEGVFKAMLAKEGLPITVHSAGTNAFPGKKASTQTIQLAEKEGVDLASHRSRKVDRQMLSEADLIFVMQNIHREVILSMVPAMKDKVLLLSQFYSHPEILPLGTEIPDPIGMNDYFYENVNDIIRCCCQTIANKLKTQMTASVAA